MAEYDNDRAFDAMKKGDPDKYITGGTIDYSKFETDFTPSERDDFLKHNAGLWKKLYDTDPNVDKKKLPYKSYLENVDVKLIEQRAQEFSDRFVSPKNKYGKKADWSQPDVPSLETSKHISDLTSDHYGGNIGMLRDMALGKGYDLY